MRAQHDTPAARRFSLRSILQNERGSNVAQAAAVAILATALIGAMLLLAPQLRGGVDQSFSCLVSVLGGGAAGCAGDPAAVAADAAEQASEFAPEQDDGGWGWGGILDGLQIGLDVIGLIPGVGEIADGLNGLISLARGDYVGAALSFGAMIPFAGWGATGAKWVRTGIRLSDEAAGVARYGDEAIQYGDEAAGAGRAADDAPVSCPIGAAPAGKAPGLAKPQAAPAANDCMPRDYTTKNTQNRSATYGSEREARQLAREKLGRDPIEYEPHKWRSRDGRWQYRAKPGDVADRHVHLERLDPKTGEVLENWHLRW